MALRSGVDYSAGNGNVSSNREVALRKRVAECGLVSEPGVKVSEHTGIVWSRREISATDPQIGW